MFTTNLALEDEPTALRAPPRRRGFYRRKAHPAAVPMVVPLLSVVPISLSRTNLRVDSSEICSRRALSVSEMKYRFLFTLRTMVETRICGLRNYIFVSEFYACVIVCYVAGDLLNNPIDFAMTLVLCPLGVLYDHLRKVDKKLHQLMLGLHHRKRDYGKRVTMSGTKK